MRDNCKMCLIREMDQAGIDIEKYKSAIKPEDRTSEDEYEKRLAICKQCVKLNAGTCFSCGCYVELKAYGKEGRCPHKKW